MKNQLVLGRKKTESCYDVHFMVFTRMPLRLKTRCRYPGCGRAVRGAYCEQHAGTKRRMDRGRGSAKERGYDRDWERVAEMRRGLDAYICRSCFDKTGRIIIAKLVDHIIPIHVRPDWRLEIDNTQVLCNGCHTAKTNEDLRLFGGRTQRTLTREQIRNIEAARALVEAPRVKNLDRWGGPVLCGSFRLLTTRPLRVRGRDLG